MRAQSGRRRSSRFLQFIPQHSEVGWLLQSVAMHCGLARIPGGAAQGQTIEELSEHGSMMAGPVNNHVAAIDALQERGVGVGCLHYAVETVDGEASNAFLRWMGGYYQLYKSVNPHWTPKFENLPDHPVANGVEPFSINDEWYFNMRFRKGMKGLTPILSAVPPQDLLPERDHHHNSTPDARAAVARRDIQHVMWVSENENGSRGFGFTGGHFHDNWQDDNLRTVVLNAIAWIAHREIPSSGIHSQTPTIEELKENQDFEYDPSKIREDKYVDRRRHR